MSVINNVIDDNNNSVPAISANTIDNSAQDKSLQVVARILAVGAVRASTAHAQTVRTMEIDRGGRGDYGLSGGDADNHAAPALSTGGVR